MALTRITKGVIKPNENYDTHNINSTGIVTAIGLDVNGNGDISGNLNVGGVLTYEDVTSIDSVGIITAQKDIHVGAGISVVGVGSFGSLDIGGDLDVDGHTNLDNVSIAGVTTTTDDIIIGADNKKLKLGAGEELQLYQSGNHSVIQHNGSHYLQLRSNAFIIMDATATKTIFIGDPNGQSALYFNGSKKLNTLNGGVDITGNLQVDSLHCLGQINLDSDIDVEGHTNLDNVSIAGVTTAAGNITISSSHPKLRLTDDTNPDFSVHVNAGSFHIRNETVNRNDFRITGDGTNELYYAGIKKLETASSGINVIGVTTTTGLAVTGVSTFTGNIDANGDIDVDGHTNLDNVSIAGVTTMSGNLTISNTDPRIIFVDTNNNPDFTLHANGGEMQVENSGSGTQVKLESSGSTRLFGNVIANKDLDVDGHTELDNVNISGVSTYAGQARFNGELVGSIISVQNSINIADKLIHSGDTDTAIRFPAANTVSVETNGIERLRIRSDGNVGIGSNNPQAEFEVFGYSSAASGAAPILAIRNGYSGTANQSNALKSELRFLHKNHNAAHEFMAARIIADTTNNYSQLTALRFLVAEGNNGTERLTIDSGGRVHIGHTSNIQVAGSNARVQVTGTTDSTAHLSIRNFSANTTGAILSLAKSRGSVGAYTAVQDDDVLGQINFVGADGTDLAEVAGKITVACDATVAGNRIPSRMEFHTTDGNGNLDLNMVLTRDGQMFLPQGITRDAMFALAHGSANDFVFGRSTGNADTGMTIVTPSATSGFINFADADGQRQGSILYQHGSGSDKMFFRTNNNTTGLIIDSAQKVYVGDASGNISPSIGGKMLVSNTNMSLNSFANNPHAQTFHLTKSRGTSGSGGTIVQDNDFCGHIEWYADDGVDTANQIAKISGRINGTPGANDTPGELIFYTTADGANSSTERLRIEADGRLVLSNSGGIQLSPQASNLYSVNGALSYYAANNAVYLNGAGDTGLLRLNATGQYNDRTSINIYGKDVANYQDVIQFRTVSEERLRIKATGETLAKTLAGNYYPVASARDGSTSARAAQSAWEIKKTLGPAAKTGYYYLINPYDNTVSQWWCDMTTDGGGWILVAHTGEGQMSSLSTADGNHWYNRSHKGGFDTVGSGYYKGGGYWRTTNGSWGENTCGQLMWDVRVDQQFGYQQYGYHDTAESNSKVVFNWGTDQALPTGGSGYSNIPNSSNRRFNEWCYEVQNAPGFNPNNYHQNTRSNVINGNEHFTEHMVMTFSFRNTSGAADQGSGGPYWMIGSHHDGLHQHYEESLSGNPQGVYGHGGYQVCSNQDTYWSNNPGGTHGGMRRLAKIDNSGTVNVWLR